MRAVPIAPDKLVPFIQTAYQLSRPQGMGMLHFNPAPMTDAEAQSIIDAADGGPIYMDYVRGRAVKLNIRINGESHFVEDRGTWFDHSSSAWRALLDIVE